MNTTISTRIDDADKYLVYAKLDNAKVLHSLVKAVSFKEVSFRFYSKEIFRPWFARSIFIINFSFHKSAIKEFFL
jgi:hypothetical protein